MRVCIVAEHASYRWGGEAVLPVHYFSRLRQQGIDAWLLVHARTRPELEALFPLDQHRLLFIEDRWFHKLISRLSRFLPDRIATTTVFLNHLLTQYLQQRVLRKLIAEESIELVHQPIPVSPRFPSLMANLGVPVVIGPMNGGTEYPPAFRHTESIFGRIGIRTGRHLSNLVNSLLPGKKRASILLVANERTRLALPSGIRGRVIQLPENGVDLDIWFPPSEEVAAGYGAATRGARFIFIGRLVDWKGVDMAIEALLQVPDAQLEIIGEGPMLGEWQRFTEKLGISGRVAFPGWLPQNACALRLHSAIALLLPSIHECGGAVVLEAMATATPVIATQWGGPMDYLDETCGLMVEPRSRELIVQGFADAMRKLIADPYLRHHLGNNGQQRVRMYFDWERKIGSMIDIYQRAISEADLYEDAISTTG
jgi:glycosyltransferase involved in cell wall biosynthesis